MTDRLAPPGTRIADSLHATPRHPSQRTNMRHTRLRSAVYTLRGDGPPVRRPVHTHEDGEP